MAIAYMATGKVSDGSPSHRYILLLREGRDTMGFPSIGYNFWMA